jgi:hypothetical protein
MQSASPAAGGIGAAPMQDGVPVVPDADMEGFGSFSGPIPPRPTNGVQVQPVSPGQPKLSKTKLWAGILADALAGFNGRPGMMAHTWQREREIEGQRATEEARWHRDRTAKREDAMQPRMEQVGDALGQYDPATQTFTPIYTKPQAFERYAQALGYKAGTPEYAQAVEDYRLGGWSDPAMENRTELETVRYDHRDDLQDQRLKASRDLAVIRDARARSGQELRRSEGVASRSLRAREGSLNRGAANGRAAASRDARAASSYPEGTVIELPGGVTQVRRNGKWVTE